LGRRTRSEGHFFYHRRVLIRQLTIEKKHQRAHETSRRRSNDRLSATPLAYRRINYNRDRVVFTLTFTAVPSPSNQIRNHLFLTVKRWRFRNTPSPVDETLKTTPLDLDRCRLRLIGIANAWRSQRGDNASFTGMHNGGGGKERDDATWWTESMVKVEVRSVPLA
jgi:hypothetical protein